MIMYLSAVDVILDIISSIYNFFLGIVDIIQVGIAGLMAFVNFVVLGFNKFMVLFDEFFDVVNSVDFPSSVQVVLGVAGFTLVISLAKYFASVFFKG
jgi:hypothetical protein